MSLPRNRILHLISLVLAILATPASALDLTRAEGSVRVATFNASLNRRGAGVLLKQLRDGRHKQILAVVEIVQRVRPDILLINEFDFDREGLALSAFARLLGEGERAIDYPHRFSAPSNTGVPSGFDLDGDGEVKGPGDAFGYGEFPGQYGMAVLSAFPLDEDETRTFRDFRWTAMPGALIPTDFYGSEAAAALRLSSKSHWDVAIDLPGARRLRLLASHPTPPVFDGPEDRNGRRNHDEIRFWADYVEGQDYFIDDAGGRGGMREAAGFVILGDLNADPEDGDGRREAVRRLLSHPSVQDPRPASDGAGAASGGVNARHKGDPSLDTADWNDERGPGNLRADFVFPSRGLEVTGAGVFWPAPGDPLHRLISGKRPASSDHRLVWVDFR